MSKKGYLGLILLVGVMAYLNPSEETQKEKIKQILYSYFNYKYCILHYETFLLYSLIFHCISQSIRD